MKKTISIRLFFISAAVGLLAYAAGYYFSSHQTDRGKGYEPAYEKEKLSDSAPADPDSIKSNAPAAGCEYVLCREDGYLIVYYADRETVYTNTDIRVDMLPERLQLEISNGKEIFSEQELFHFLENYSS